ncbi:hypothetical protein GOV08_02920 [Candidatus Woesearchaeota archaeon]|nr:hypothetical protein [Candidatus Woesearchaeota archaeon]
MRARVTIILFMLLFGMFAGTVLADPAGPASLVNGTPETLPVRPALSAIAYAGNITEINLTAWTVTRTWQGYYGQVSGTIILADANNYTMYDWRNTNPDGRVYAARVNNVDWSTIACAAQSELDTDEAQFTGTNDTNRDGEYPLDRPNATFVSFDLTGGASTARSANYSTFWIGSVQIDNNSCLSTSMHNSTATSMTDQNVGNDPDRFRELILADGSGTGDIVYTAILEDDYTGFDGVAHDFQMIVGEDGHGTNTATSTYYFYVELE